MSLSGKMLRSVNLNSRFLPHRGSFTVFRSFGVKLLVLVALFPAPWFTARADEARTALVIGNSRYASAPLPNPEHDAADIANALRGSGFAVDLVLDASKANMMASIGRFGDALTHRKGVGFFYYAGHGAQIAGENYLVPVDAATGDESSLKQSAVSASLIVDAAAAAEDTLNILVLDACRDNPLGSTRVRGLSRIDTSDRLFVSFSTKPGAVAFDGDDRNSPYAKHLALAIATPRLNLESVFKRTLKGVYQETQGQQTPWLSSSYFGEFVFRQGPPGPAIGGQEEEQAKPQRTLAGVYRSDGINPNGTRYKGITAVNWAGNQVQVKWWIGKQIFAGVGEFAGKMLVVNWGDTHPVIYTFGKHGFLNGEWADGKANERLELFASVAPAARSLSEGHYAVTGHNPNGTSYDGAVDISKRPSGDYSFDWKVGRDAYHGEGKLDGGILTVHWGAEMPVVYALTGDNELKGLWSGGGGEETLSLEE